MPVFHGKDPILGEKRSTAFTAQGFNRNYPKLYKDPSSFSLMRGMAVPLALPSNRVVLFSDVLRWLILDSS